MRFAIPAFIALTACMPQPVVEPGEDACGASGYAGLIGQSKNVLAAMTFPAPMRVIEPGSAITMDYNAERLNIDLDESGNIARVWCG